MRAARSPAAMRSANCTMRLQPARRGLRCDAGNDERHHECQQRSEKQLAADPGERGFDIGKRIGQTDRAASHRRSHIEKWDADGPAAARSSPDIAFQGGHKLGALRVIFHGRGISLGVRPDPALRVNNGGACPGCPAVFCDDTLQTGQLRGIRRQLLVERRKRAHAIHMVGKHLGLLPETEVDLLQQRILPGMVNREIEGHGGCRNHQGKRSQQLEKYRFLTSFLTSEPRSDSRPPAPS